MLAFWIDSHNLTRLTGLADSFTGVLFTDQTISSITGKLLDSNGVQVGDDIPFVYDEPGKWHAVWQRTMTEGATHRLRVEIIVRALLPALLSGARPDVQDGARQPLLRKALQDRVRQVWGPLLLVVLLTGCTRTILIPPGEPVRIRETIKNAKVWVIDKDGKPVAGVVDIPPGWYALPVDLKEQ